MSSKQKSSFDDSVAICNELDFAASEAYKMLRTSVQYGFPDVEGCKIIGITSSERNEGKSTIATNLAYMLSCDSQKVLLMEGDMRLPSLSAKLDLPSTQGLSDYLTGRITSDSNFIQYSKKAPNLPILCAGMAPPNPSELLGSERMKKFLDKIRNAFDFIILDLPPVNIVSDPLSVAKYIDGFIIVTRNEFTTRYGVTEVVKKLKIVDAKILGFVLNGDGVSNGSSYSKKYSKYSKYDKYSNGKYGKGASYDDGSYEESYDTASRKKKEAVSAQDPQNSDDKNQL